MLLVLGAIVPIRAGEVNWFVNNLILTFALERYASDLDFRA